MIHNGKNILKITHNGKTINKIMHNGKAIMLGYTIPTINLKTYGAIGDGVTDDTAIIQSAINSLGGELGTIYIPAGTYVCNNLYLASNITLQGESQAAAILMQKANITNTDLLRTNQTGTSNPLENNVNIKLYDLTLRGRCDTEVFAEQAHTFVINAATGVTCARVQFKGFKGDGAYIGDYNALGNPRFSRNVSFQNCVFDGIDKDNRNPISVISVNGLTINACEFKNATRPDMPGAIDIEPNSADVNAELFDITITNNTFNNIGGNGGVICGNARFACNNQFTNVLIQNNVLGDNSCTKDIYIANSYGNATKINNNIKILDNIVTRTTDDANHADMIKVYHLCGCEIGGNELTTPLIASAARPNGIYWGMVGAITDAIESCDVRIHHNDINGSAYPFQIVNAKGVEIDNNTIANCIRNGLIGVTSASAHAPCWDINHHHNIYNQASLSISALRIGDVTRLQIDDNEFDDCGDRVVGGTQAAIEFYTHTNPCDYIYMRRNITRSTLGYMPVSVAKNAARVYGANNINSGNTWHGTVAFTPAQ